MNAKLSLEDIKEFLRPLLFGLSEEDLTALSQATTVRTCPPDTVICQEGETGETIYFIVEGAVDIIKQLTPEQERHLHTIGAGQYFGEMAILQQEGKRTATVRTIEPTTLLELDQTPFLRVLGRSPALGIRILIHMADRLRDSDQQAIEELRRANEELRRTLRQLEQLDQTKSDFIQVSAHELRTPVAALQGYAQMMQNNTQVQKDHQMSKLVEGVVTATERLHRVFNSILDVSRMVTGEIDIHPSPVNLHLVVRGIQRDSAAVIEERGLTFEMEGLQELPAYQGDPVLLHKAFQHLVNNAIKYTPDEGHIKVTGRATETPDLGRCIEVAVEDTGIGIAEEDLDLIFEKFYRTGEVALHSSGTTTFKGGGPGLGLAIAKGAVEAHQGNIWAESPGYDEETCPGSRFVVQLPMSEDAT